MLVSIHSHSSIRTSPSTNGLKGKFIDKMLCNVIQPILHHTTIYAHVYNYIIIIATPVAIPMSLSPHLVTHRKLLIGRRIHTQPLPCTTAHLNIIMTQTPQKMTPLGMLQERLLEIHVSHLHDHVDDAGVLDAGVFVEFVTDCFFGFGDVCVVDGAWEFSLCDCV